MYSSQLLKETFEAIILKLLTENETMYGYELIQKVKELSDEEISFPAGSLYPILHKMEEKSLVTTRSIELVERVVNITP